MKGGPDRRRRFLNEMLVQAVPGYARRLASYRRALEQRNGLLKRVAAGHEPASGLDVWDEALAGHGEAIEAARTAAVAELAPIAAGHHAAVGMDEALSVEYDGPQGALLDELQRHRGEDIRRGSTSIGPHRDDVLIRINGMDARSFASQGQQRTAVVAMKLAEADLLEHRSGERPIVLLDDVLSELDAGRRRALLAGVAGRGQVIVTAVDAEVFPGGLTGDAVVRCISRGQIEACGQDR